MGVRTREALMNGNPAYHAVALATATVLLLPLPLAILAGWRLPRLPSRALAVPYAWALLCLYALAPLNAVPRMLDAPTSVVTACTAAALAFSAAAVACLIRAVWVSREVWSVMPGIRVVSWLRDNVTEFRVAVTLVGTGVATTLAGVVVYAHSGPGSPEVIIGLSCLTTGVVMLGAGARRR